MLAKPPSRLGVRRFDVRSKLSREISPPMCTRVLRELSPRCRTRRFGKLANDPGSSSLMQLRFKYRCSRCFKFSIPSTCRIKKHARPLTDRMSWQYISHGKWFCSYWSGTLLEVATHKRRRLFQKWILLLLKVITWNRGWILLSERRFIFGVIVRDVYRVNGPVSQTLHIRTLKVELLPLWSCCLVRTDTWALEN